MADFKKIFAQTLNFEGGYQNDAADNANVNSKGERVGTNRGISAQALEEYWRQTGVNKVPTVADMKAVTKELSEKVYKKLFWDRIRGDSIASYSVAWIIFDSYIAYGNLKRAKRGINKYYGSEKFPVDTKSLTTEQVEMLNKADAKVLFEAIKNNEIQARKDIVKANPAKEKFLKGWLNRLDNIKFSDAAFFLVLSLFCSQGKINIIQSLDWLQSLVRLLI